MTGSVFGVLHSRLASRIAVLMLALASSYFLLYTIRFVWGQPAGFGIGIDLDSTIVNYIDPRDAGKGIGVGDRVDLAAMSFHDRGYLYALIVKPLGRRMIVPVFHNGRRVTATFETASGSYTRDQRFFFLGPQGRRHALHRDWRHSRLEPAERHALGVGSFSNRYT